MTTCSKTVSGKHWWAASQVNTAFKFKGSNAIKLKKCSLCGIIDDSKVDYDGNEYIEPTPK